MKKILYITTPDCDYLQDSLLHGLKTVLGKNVVDYPQKIQMYNDFPYQKEQLYGRGFTLYCNLNSSLKSNINNPLENLEQFDFVIFSSIHRQVEIFMKMIKSLNPANTIIIDGEDFPYYFPMLYKAKSNVIKYFSILKFIRRCKYFKREFTKETKKGILYKMSFNSNIMRNIYPLSFSIPEEKIKTDDTIKTKLFPIHIVDAEVSQFIQNTNTGHSFPTESTYYNDLQKSKFGITTKRAGWDCLRHYEIAANNSVICFRALDSKEDTCAPYGLNKTNCIIYENYEHLMKQINEISDVKYKEFQVNSHKWILKNTTKHRALEFLDAIEYNL